MLQKLFLLLIIIIPATIYAQEPNTVEFKYDDAGNRILRHAIYIAPSSKKCDSTNANYYKEPADTFVFDKINVNIYPNPTISKFNVTIENMEKDDIIEYSFYSLTGQIISNGKINTSSTEFSMRNHKRGPYIFHITVNGKPKSWRIIKQ